MSFFDSVTKLAEEFSSKEDHDAAATRLMEHLAGSSGYSVLSPARCKRGHPTVCKGTNQGVDPGAIEQVVGGSAFLDSIA